MVPIILLVHLQRAGHKPFALIGGATGLVGDPSGKSEERILLTEEILQHNLSCVRHQLEKFLNFNPTIPNSAEIVNNYDWFKEISFLDFIRDTGKHITINYMMAKDSVKKRLESENGMSFTEFSYQLVQGYDFYWLYKNRNCKLQMGGSDQWGNILTGSELIRRKIGGEAFAFTCPLITKADGGKFGKTEKGNVWLDPAKTTPFQFYQFWLNASDKDAIGWLKIFTFLDQHEVKKIISEHEKDPGARALQKVLARELTLFVHTAEDLQKALETTKKLFNRSGSSNETLTESELFSIEGIVKCVYSKDKILSNPGVISFLTDNNIFISNGEARKMILNGGLTINNKKVTDPAMTINEDDLLHNKFVMVQKGKKNYFLIEII